ncbi:hypothetical protein PR048_009251 [Dryococelus australis]|uniref:Reverse transcriptase RNase H-like domain-containing protein n=1 Tax=Dryococelus australis TaxID=614101 RepID=A0ABQ9I0G4_9NEOP|nr:hypothetical protein PR048_009251 [Dryococelus australis]
MDNYLKFFKVKITRESKSKLFNYSRHVGRGKLSVRGELGGMKHPNFYRCKMFNARQGKAEQVAGWGSELNGTQALIDNLVKACFVKHLGNYCVQLVVHSKGLVLLGLGNAVEVALEEKSNLYCQHEKLGGYCIQEMVCRDPRATTEPVIDNKDHVNLTGEEEANLPSPRKMGRESWLLVFPIPRITEILEQLGQVEYLSTLDLASRYLQVRMNPEGRAKTVFSTPTNPYEFTQMMLGLKGVSTTFEQLTKTCTWMMWWCTEDRGLSIMVEYIMEDNLKVQPDKREFLRNEVTYLGHMPYPSKVNMINVFLNKPQRKKTTQVVSRFINGYGRIAKPLYELLKDQAKYEWGNKQDWVFEALKDALVCEPVLQYPDFEQPFFMVCQLNIFKAERNYSTTEWELYSIIWAVKYFRHYLLRCHLTIVSDHKSLTWIFSLKDPSSRLL